MPPAVAHHQGESRAPYAARADQERRFRTRTPIAWRDVLPASGYRPWHAAATAVELTRGARGRKRAAAWRANPKRAFGATKIPRAVAEAVLRGPPATAVGRVAGRA